MFTYYIVSFVHIFKLHVVESHIIFLSDQTCPFNAAACIIDLAEHNATKR